MKAIVNLPQRYAKMRAHTATHLLHFMLHSLLPGGTKQAGSLVDNDLLRFDFSAKQALSKTELDTIQDTINSYIYAALPVTTKEMSFADAQKTGAKAFFEDTYGDRVRVVSILDTRKTQDNLAPLNSIELCGGTHIENTKDIGAFQIISQESVASGVRRITAYTGTKVAQAYQDLSTTMQGIAQQLDCTPKQIPEKLEKILKELIHIKQDHESLQGKIVGQHLEELHTSCQLPGKGSNRGAGCIINISGTDLAHHSFKEVVNQAKAKRSDRNRILYTNEGNFAIYISTGDMSAKAFAKEHGLKGGGSDQLVQGKDEGIVKIFS